MLILLLLSVASRVQSAHELLGCKTSRGEVGTCLPREMCPSGAQNICHQFPGDSAACCTIPSHKKHASHYCKLYQNKTCPSLPASPDLPIKEVVYSPYPIYAIAGGKLSLARANPFMAVLGYGEKKEWLCGGTLVSEKFVLTAAHCAHHSTLGGVRVVRLGDLDLSREDDDADVQEALVSRRHVHPGYSPPALYQDIALLELAKPVKWTDHVKPICLLGLKTLPFSKATVVGWGRTGPAEAPSPALREVELSLVRSSRCKQLRPPSRLAPKGIDPVTMICAGEEEGGKDSCQGDSGGPMVVWESMKCLASQVGITSFGGLCGQPESPAVYTRVAPFIPWIESIVWP